MSRRGLARLIGPLLALATLATGCQAPGARATLGLRPAAPAARARLSLQLRPAAGYGLQYVEARDWDEAIVKVTCNGQDVAEGTAPATRGDDGARSARLTFESLPPDAGYAVAVRLMGRDGQGAAVEVGTIAQDGFTLVSGANDVAIDAAPTWTRLTTAPAGTAAGFVGAVVGSFPAAGPGVRLRAPAGVAQAADGTLYVADSGNHRILQVDPDGTVTVLAGGPAGFADGVGAAARFRSPGTLLLVARELYICDAGNHAVRRLRLDADGGPTVSTVAGDGTAGDSDGVPAGGIPARLRSPDGLACDPEAGVVYVADTGNHKLRAIALDGEAVVTTTIAGTGAAAHMDADVALAAKFSSPRGLYLFDGVLYVADAGNHVIRALNVDGLVAARVGTALGEPGQAGFAEGVGDAARLSRPQALAGSDVRAFLDDADNRRVRVIDFTGGREALSIQTYAGTGDTGYHDSALGSSAFPGDLGLGYHPSKGLVIADLVANRVRRVDPEFERLAAVVGDGAAGDLLGDAFRASAVKLARAAFFSDGAALVSDPEGHRLWRIAEGVAPTVFAGPTGLPDPGYAEGAAAAARFSAPMGLVADGRGGFFVADAGNHVIRLVDASGATSLVAGHAGAAGWADGSGADARFERPWALAYDAGTGVLYVAEHDGQRVRRLTPSTSGWSVATVAGDLNASTGDTNGAGGPNGSVRFHRPVGLALAADGTLYVADAENHRIRAIADPAGQQPMVTTAAGSGDDASLDGPVDGPALEASFASLTDLAIAADGALWAIDGHRMRRLARPGEADAAVSSPAGGSTPGFVDGPGLHARFDGPLGLTRGPADRLWVSDTGNHWLRVVKP